MMRTGLIFSLLTLTARSGWAANFPLAVPGTGQQAETTSQNEILWLLVPFFLFVGLALILCWAALYQFFAQLDEYLAGHKRRRLVFLILFLGVPSACEALLVEAIDWSSIFDGNFKENDLLWTNVLSCVVALHLAAFLTFARHGDSWDLRLQTADARCEAATQNQKFAVNLLTFCRSVVGGKTNTLREQLSNGDNPQLRAALAPNEALVRIVLALFDLYHSKLRTVSPESTLRIAYFTAKDGYLEAVEAYNGTDHGCVSPAQTSSTTRERFRLECGASDCLAVWAAHKRNVAIVEDAEDADGDADHAFVYFHPLQRNHIGSLVVIPICRSTDPAPARHVICIDTSLKGFFRLEDQPQFRLAQMLVQEHLLHEIELHNLVAALDKAT